MNTTPFSTRHVTSATTSDPPSDQEQRQLDHMRRTRATGERALVLAGAGAAGNAWEIGIIAGLFEAGLDVTEADLTIGTSAGSTAAAQITSGTQPTELLADILDAQPQPRTSRLRSDGGQAPKTAGEEFMERTSAIIAVSEDPADMRRRMGAAALDTDGASQTYTQTRWRAVVAARLPSQHWPQRRMLIVAVDAHTGEPVVFDRHSGVDLVDAVAASTSNGFGIPPYRIGGNRYINGGYRCNENADLAAGYRRVLVLSPFGGRTRHPLDWCMQLATQIDELRAGGSRVETIFPDSNSEHMFGANAMDLSLRPPAARAGYNLGTVRAEQLTDSGADACGPAGMAVPMHFTRTTKPRLPHEQLIEVGVDQRPEHHLHEGNPRLPHRQSVVSPKAAERTGRLLSPSRDASHSRNPPYPGRSGPRMLM